MLYYEFFNFTNSKNMLVKHQHNKDDKRAGTRPAPTFPDFHIVGAGLASARSQINLFVILNFICHLDFVVCYLKF